MVVVVVVVVVVEMVVVVVVVISAHVGTSRIVVSIFQSACRGDPFLGQALLAKTGIVIWSQSETSML